MAQSFVFMEHKKFRKEKAIACIFFLVEGNVDKEIDNTLSSCISD